MGHVHTRLRLKPLNIITVVSTAGTARMTGGRARGISSLAGEGSEGIFVGTDELALLSTSGSAWTAINNVANGALGTPDLKNQDNKHCTKTFATAVVANRTNNDTLREKVRAAIMAAVGTESVGSGNMILSLGRQLGSYVIAADLIGLSTFSPSDDTTFRSWLSNIRTQELGGHGTWHMLEETHQISSNNWGAYAGASLIAAHAYLGDTTGLNEAWNTFQGFCGDRTKHIFPDVTFDAASVDTWRCTGEPWRPINSVGTCGDKLGAPPEDAHRSGPYPEIDPLYVQETMCALAVQAEILQRAGFTDAWSKLQLTSDFATLWSVWNASAVGRHMVWLYNKRLGAGAPTLAATEGRLIGWTDWIYPA